MRSGNWQGAALTLALTSALMAGTARADLFCPTIPREVDAVDVRTGGPYMAPPIPYGHYAKDSKLAGVMGCLSSGLGLCKGACGGLLHGGCCGKSGCGTCGGNGCGGDGCGDEGCGSGHQSACGDPGCISGGGFGCKFFHRNPCDTSACWSCGGSGCGVCEGKHRLHGLGCGGLFHKGGGCIGKASTGICGIMPSAQVSPQSPLPSAQCFEPGCHLKRRHFHRRGHGCNACNGLGCGICLDPGQACGNLCGSCNGAGCGSCFGKGICDSAGLCNNCHGAGCGLCGGKGGCNACGGKGCSLCCGKVKSLLGLPHALLAKALHKGDIKYFVGPGGPVPITPGYVPYVVTTRSPRDFLAFPPFVDIEP